MPEPNVAVVDKPPVVPPVSTIEAPKTLTIPEPLTEEQITETYLEARREGKVDDLPIPPPTIREAPPEPPKLIDETPIPPDVAEMRVVDEYIETRKGEKEAKAAKRKQRAGIGGKQARIDQITREKAELEAKATDLEAKLATIAATAAPPVTATPEGTPATAVAATPEPVTPPVATPKQRPRMNEYTDADEYHAAMALWAIDEAVRTGKSVPVAEQPKAAAAPATNQVQKEEFDRFLEAGKQFITGHSDFNTVLEGAHVRGLTMSEAARIEITRKAAPQVAYWLAKPENDMAARAFMQMDDMGQLVEIGRIMERLSASPSDFVSQAPAPGLRLTGSSARAEVPLNQITDTDEYIRLRRQQRRGRRR
jgi:hypothetical protein